MYLNFHSLNSTNIITPKYRSTVQIKTSLQEGQVISINIYLMISSMHYHKYFFLCQDKDSGKTSVVVGTWNQEEHIEWAKKNTARAYHLQDDGTQTVR